MNSDAIYKKNHKLARIIRYSIVFHPKQIWFINFVNKDLSFTLKWRIIWINPIFMWTKCWHISLTTNSMWPQLMVIQIVFSRVLVVTSWHVTLKKLFFWGRNVCVVVSVEMLLSGEFFTANFTCKRTTANVGLLVSQ